MDFIDGGLAGPAPDRSGGVATVGAAPAGQVAEPGALAGPGGAPDPKGGVLGTLPGDQGGSQAPSTLPGRPGAADAAGQPAPLAVQGDERPRCAGLPASRRRVLPGAKRLATLSPLGARPQRGLWSAPFQFYPALLLLPVRFLPRPGIYHSHKLFTGILLGSTPLSNPKCQPCAPCRAPNLHSERSKI